MTVRLPGLSAQVSADPLSASPGGVDHVLDAPTRRSRACGTSRHRLASLAGRAALRGTATFTPTPPVAPLAPLALLALVFLASGCQSLTGARPPTLARFEFREPQMGVPFRMVLFATNETHAARAAQAAFQRIRELNLTLSDYDPESEVSRLCHDTPAGRPVPVSPDLWHLLERGQDLARRTDGAFDVTVGPLANLWRRARRQGQLPSPDLLAVARERTGWQKLRLDPRRRTLTFALPDMRLDFGGIAKGYAADEALAVLRSQGITRALVAAAGDITAGDPPPGQAGWRVEIGATDLPDGPAPRIVWLRHGAIATSGDLFQRLEIDGRRYSHILDPRTGIGLTDHSLVTVLARDGTTADSLATAVSVLGPGAGLRLVDQTPGAATLILRAPGTTVETTESRRLPRWLRVPAGSAGTPAPGPYLGTDSTRKN